MFVAFVNVSLFTVEEVGVKKEVLEGKRAVVNSMCFLGYFWTFPICGGNKDFLLNFYSG